MSDIGYWDSQLTEDLKSVYNDVQAMRSLSSEAKLRAVTVADRKLADAAMHRRTYQMEVRGLEDAAMRAQYQVKLESYDRQLEDLKREVKLSRREAEAAQRGELLGDRAEEEFDVSGHRDDRLKAAHSLQDKTEAALRRTQQTAVEMNDTASAVAEKLAGQTEQLRGIDGELKEIQSEVDRAMEISKTMMRRLATNKLIMLFTVLIVTGTAALLIYMAVGKQNATP